MLKATISEGISSSVYGIYGLSPGSRYCERLEIEGHPELDKKIAIYREGHGPKPWFLRWNYKKVQVGIKEQGQYQTQSIWINKNSLRKRFHQIEGSSPVDIIGNLMKAQKEAASKKKSAEPVLPLPLPPHRLSAMGIIKLPNTVETALAREKAELLINRLDDKTHFYPNLSPFSRPAMQQGRNLYVLLTKSKLGDVVLGHGSFKQVKEAIHYIINDSGQLEKQTESDLVVAITRFKGVDGKKTERESQVTQTICKTEAVFLQKLQGLPNVIQAHAEFTRKEGNLGKHGARQYLVLSRAKIDLFDALTDRRLPPDKTQVGAKIAQAIAELHEMRILHRDIKLENVMLDNKGNPHLIDFGLACNQADKNARSNICGSYLAPEQGKAALSQKVQSYISSNDYSADNFSLGLLLLDLFATKGDSIREFFYGHKCKQNAYIFQEQLNDTIAKCGIPENLLNAFRGLLSVDPTTRMTAQQAADNLRRLPLKI